MRILITGGVGFVGGRLAQHLHHAGHEIILGSRNASSPPDWLPQAEVKQTKWHDGRALEQVCNGADVLIHAAGMNAQDCLTDPVAALEINGLATARLLEAASRSGVKRFVCLSTAHVYASPLMGTITEESCPRNLHPYAASHLAGENVVLSAGERGEIEGIVLRLSNAFGAPAHKNANCWVLLVNDLCRQAVQSGKLVLRSSGLQQRDFISITEVVRVATTLSTRALDVQLHGIFNVGSGVSQSVLELAQIVQQRCKLVLGFEPELQRLATGADERHEKLEYRTDKLNKIGLTVSINHSDEIDSLLAFCSVSFKRSAIA
jgi:UDP-glucose 4-epimerase